MVERADAPGARQWRLFLWLCAALRGDHVDWPSSTEDRDALLALAGAHFITPTLAATLADDSSLPQSVRDYLQAVAFLNGERNEQIMAAISNATECLAAVGIRAVFLKGAAHLADGLYRDPADRFLGDVDLLVPRYAAPAAAKALAIAGFSQTDALPRRWIALRHHHLPMQRHIESGVGIEIHEEILYPAYQHLLSSEIALHTAVPARLLPHVLVPAPEVRALHAIFHDQLGRNWRRQHCGLRMLCDVSRLMARPDAEENLANLTDKLPGSARRIVGHGLALVGLLGHPVDLEETRRASSRLQGGIERPGLALPDSVISGFLRLRAQPAAAINLLDPRWWPEWLARLRK